MDKYVHGVYKYVCDEEIVYVGKTNDSFLSRINAHKKEEKFQPYLNNCDIYYFICQNKLETDLYEKMLINKYKPRLNIEDKLDDSFSIKFEEPHWIRFDVSDFKRPKPQNLFEISARARLLETKIAKLRSSIVSYEKMIESFNECRAWLIKFPMDCLQVDEDTFCYFSGHDLSLSFVNSDCFPFHKTAINYCSKFSKNENYITNYCDMNKFKNIEGHKKEYLENLDKGIVYYKDKIDQAAKQIDAIKEEFQ